MSNEVQKYNVGDEVRGEWRLLQEEEPCDSYRSGSILNVVTQKKLQLTGHVARMKQEMLCEFGWEII